MTGILIRQEETHRGMASEDGGRHWNKATTDKRHQGLPESPEARIDA